MYRSGLLGAPWPLVLIALALFATSSAAADSEGGRVTFSTGLDFSRGDYGQEEKTDIWYLPLTLAYERGPWIAKVTVPLIQIEGPGDVVGGTEGSVVIGGGAGERSRERGLGDIVTSLSYVIYVPDSIWPLVELTGKVKFGTADEEDGLGTGENDYTAQLDLAKTIGRVTPFVTVGHRWIGEPSGVELDNVLFASAGLGLRLTRRLSVGAIYDFKEAASDASEDSRELVPYLSLRLSEHMKVGTYTVIGLSDSSPDLGLGFNVGYSW